MAEMYIDEYHGFYQNVVLDNGERRATTDEEDEIMIFCEKNICDSIVKKYPCVDEICFARFEGYIIPVETFEKAKIAMAEIKAERKAFRKEMNKKVPKKSKKELEIIQEISKTCINKKFTHFVDLNDYVIENFNSTYILVFAKNSEYFERLIMR